MTLDTLADLVGLSKAHVLRLENGERNLAVKHFAAFAKALRVEPKDLVNPITEDDRKLIEALRRAAPAKKAAIAVLLGVETDLTELEQPSSSPGKHSATQR